MLDEQCTEGDRDHFDRHSPDRSAFGALEQYVQPRMPSCCDGASSQLSASAVVFETRVNPLLIGPENPGPQTKFKRRRISNFVRDSTARQRPGGGQISAFPSPALGARTWRP
jgi:hypothetical protein